MSIEVAATESEPIAPSSPATTAAGAPPVAEHAPPMLVIEPPRGWVSLNLKEVWRYRDLMKMLIWRDISSKYRQSVIGYGWVFIKPLVSVAIFVVVFSRLANLGTDGAPSPLFYLAALLPWNYFAGSLSGVSSSVLGGSGMLTKVYFPRLILPLASLGAGLADLALQLVLLVGMMIWFRVFPGWPILLMPCFLLLTVATSLAFGLWLTALNVRYRDVGHAVPFLVQAWFYVSPVVYSSSLVPSKWRWLYGLNPLVGVIDGFRWCVLGTAAPDPTLLALSLTIVAVTLFGGLVFFRRQEISFADII